ncbi:hypothetical protein SARC_05079 [Sphaeroforma arctica JP610]|uniref:Phospholipid/glycerol acyltransferase domain-containing protein n=1 Tax=Sphaeroforma arctica JP610 TaxID=667725 RepID=A0A0L0G1E6_9EUKA|nr:hypothetical protein SARC_05079 [Sphaeroforma arctica JP610]KNC82639.1 hypothetical protein SARC_05079 [Sphaeroforma arctica JP610]|eukprot:XP_014156541.1 hypothetical protein SARC_05079 [Sphaeroforma arctica JP610]
MSCMQLCGLKFVFSGDEFVSTDACIVASNHRNRLDWLFLWGLFVRYGRLQYHKIMLKAPLKHLPGPGWATQAMCFLFVERSWEKDEAYISSWIQYYQNQNYPLQLVMFPEGTDLSAGNLKRSHAFSEKSGLPVYEYVMHPRVKGFCSTVQQLRSTTDAVYDVTIGYPKGLPQNEKELAMGMFPGEVHIHVKRYLMMSIPDNEDDLGQWVKDRWADKEQRLKAFYAQARKGGWHTVLV